MHDQTEQPRGWFKDEMERARNRREEVPEWARPKVLDKPTTPIPGDGHPA